MAPKKKKVVKKKMKVTKVRAGEEYLVIVGEELEIHTFKTMKEVSEYLTDSCEMSDKGIEEYVPSNLNLAESVVRGEDVAKLGVVLRVKGASETRLRKESVTTFHEVR